MGRVSEGVRWLMVPWLVLVLCCVGRRGAKKKAWWTLVGGGGVYVGLLQE